MKRRYWLLIGSIILAATVPVHSSQETNVEIATGTTCEKLLATTEAQFGSLVDVEYAIAFAFEEQYNIYIARSRDGKSAEISERSAKNNEALARLGAMHSLVQNPKCPIDKDWYRLKLEVFTEEDWWFTDN